MASCRDDPPGALRRHHHLPCHQRPVERRRRVRGLERCTRHPQSADKLSDRELDDIGLCRGDIELIAADPPIRSG